LGLHSEPSLFGVFAYLTAFSVGFSDWAFILNLLCLVFFLSSVRLCHFLSFAALVVTVVAVVVSCEVTPLELFERKRQMYFVMDFCSGGDL